MKVLAAILLLAAFLPGLSPAFASGGKDGGENSVLERVLNLMEDEYLYPFDKDACREEISEALFAGRRTERKTDCLDPYFRYFSAERSAKNISERSKGEYSGVGISLLEAPEGMEIVGVRKGGPAGKAGVKKGDILLSVRNEGEKAECRISGRESLDCVNGEVGTKVFLTVRRDGKILTLAAVRAKIDLKEVFFKKLPGGALYVAVKRFFLPKTPKDFLSAMERADPENPRVIIDLRGNPGGRLSFVLETLYHFSAGPDKVIISKKYKNGEETVTAGDQRWYYRIDGVFTPSPGDAPGRFSRYRAVILIDEGSASAAEIFAGVLKEWGFPIIGKTSYGKGVGQAYFLLPNAYFVGFTVFEYRVGNSGTRVNKIGIEPDYSVKDSRKSPSDTATKRDRQFMAAVEVLKKMK